MEISRGHQGRRAGSISQAVGNRPDAERVNASRS
jgi:hypothetical protein